MTGLVNVLKDFENVNEVNLLEWRQSDLCDAVLRRFNDAASISGGAKQSDDVEKNGRDWDGGGGGHEGVRQRVALGYYTWVTEGLKVRILQP